MEIFPPVPQKNVLLIAGEKEILCHFLHRESQPSISRTLQVSRNMVSKSVTAYQVQGLEPGAVSALPDEVRHRQLFPGETDSFLLPVNDNCLESLLELLEYRLGKVSTIFCSQLSYSGWHQQLGGGAVANDILDRIIPGSYKLEIQGQVAKGQRLAEEEMKST